MTLKEALESGYCSLDDEFDFNDTPQGEEIACLKLEIERLKKREQECIEHYLVQCKYASEMESKYITANYVINELEKWLKDDNILTFDFTGSINKSEGTLISDEEISKKIEELKGSD